VSRERDDRVRGFPAFPPGPRGPGRLARSWWGNAWIKAMQDTSLDQEPLRQGRRYACAGQVGTITVSPGRIAAPVYGLHDAPYRTVVLIERLTEAQWDRFLDQVTAKAGHIAALLDRDMPRDLVLAAEDAGVRLLPGMGDLEPECSCPEWEHPCKHAAALCYQASWLLDEDPFVLLLMRGRGRAELVAELQRRKAGRAGPQAPPSAAGEAGAARPPMGGASGTPAREAYARGVPPLPPPPPPPGPFTSTAGVLSAVLAAPGVDPGGLQLLVTDAALRARELLTDERPRPGLDVWQDTVRMAATHGDPRLRARLRQALGEGPRGTVPGTGRGRTAADLERAVRAWRYGGLPGLEVLERPWSPPPGDARLKGELSRAAAVLARVRDEGAWGKSTEPARARLRLNRWTVEELGVQLRYGGDGRWHPYRQEPGGWWPAGPPEHDAGAALARLLAG
jgi:uncharacterized Zn finger protein